MPLNPTDKESFWIMNVGRRSGEIFDENRISENASQTAFTLIELLVIIGVMAVLSLTLLPAFASAAQKGGRVQCAANLRQLGAASMLYANDFRSWLPIWFLDAGHPVNKINGMTYTRYACFQASPFTKIPQSYSNSFTQAGGTYQNLGFLYAGNYIGAGEALYCPAQSGGVLGAENYVPLLTSDSGGTVRSSYAFNPRLIDTNLRLRLFQRTTQFEPGKVLAVDYLTPFSAHNRERGWNVLLTDGSVKFSTSDRAYSLVSNPNFTDDESIQTLQTVALILDALEVDR
jgi:type II secretory pathway pseudopilin PulG